MTVQRILNWDTSDDALSKFWKLPKRRSTPVSKPSIMSKPSLLESTAQSDVHHYCADCCGQLPAYDVSGEGAGLFQVHGAPVIRTRVCEKCGRDLPCIRFLVVKQPKPVSVTINAGHYSPVKMGRE